MYRWMSHALLWLTGLLPALIAFFSLPAGSFDTAAAALNALGRLTGIGGLGLLLVAAIVSFRIPGFDRLFGGLTTLWHTHHLMGGVSFLLLLAHPLLLALAASRVSLATAVAVLFPAAGTAIWLGWGALLLMMVFLAPSFSFFGTPHYQRWKSLHRLSGLTAVLALAHTFMLARTTAEPWSTLIWLALASAAIAALIYGLVFSRRATQHRYTVTGVAQPANNVVELSLVPVAKPLRYQAGQFVYLTPYDSKLQAGYREEHPYTLSSAPEEPELRIAIKDLGDASRAIQSIAHGSDVRIMGPYLLPRPQSRQGAVGRWRNWHYPLPGPRPPAGRPRRSGGYAVTLLCSGRGEGPVRGRVAPAQRQDPRLLLDYALLLQGGAAGQRLCALPLPGLRRAPGIRLWPWSSEQPGSPASAGCGYAAPSFPQRGVQAAMKKLCFSAFIAFWSSIATLVAVQVLATDPAPAAAAQPTVTLDELAAHDSESDCWMAIEGKVYNLTGYLPNHPTPAAVLLPWCGREATESMRTKGYGRDHSPVAWGMLDDYLVGTLADD